MHSARSARLGPAPYYEMLMLAEQNLGNTEQLQHKATIQPNSSFLNLMPPKSITRVHVE